MSADWRLLLTRTPTSSKQRGACKGGLDRQSPTCWSTFSTFGHFEHLLQVDGSTAAGVRQWYAPSLIADLGDASAKDYIPLPSLHGNVSSTDATAADQDFAFAYRIAFSISSVRKLSFLQNMHKSIRIETSKLTADRQNMTAYDQAWNHDSTEFWNALRGHTFEPGTRPVARGVLEFISGLLDFLAPAVQLYFFLTRCVHVPSLCLDLCVDGILRFQQVPDNRPQSAGTCPRSHEQLLLGGPWWSSLLHQRRRPALHRSLRPRFQFPTCRSGCQPCPSTQLVVGRPPSVGTCGRQPAKTDAL